MGFFSDLFGGGEEEAGQAIAQAAQQGIGTEKDMLAKALALLQPFITGGTGAMGDLQSLLSQEKDPAAFINQILSGYQESPYQKFTTQQGIEAGRQGAEASGMAGSGAEEKALTKYAEEEAQSGQQGYLSNILGLQTQREQGLQGLYTGGLSAAGEGATTTTNVANSIADLLGQMGKGRAMEALGSAGGLSGLLGSLGGALTGGIMGERGLLGKGIGGGFGALLGFL